MNTRWVRGGEGNYDGIDSQVSFFLCITRLELRAIESNLVPKHETCNVRPHAFRARLFTVPYFSVSHVVDIDHSVRLGRHLGLLMRVKLGREQNALG